MVAGTRLVRVEQVGRRSGLGRGDHLLPRQDGRGRDEGTLERSSLLCLTLQEIQGTQEMPPTPGHLWVEPVWPPSSVSRAV